LHKGSAEANRKISIARLIDQLTKDGCNCPAGSIRYGKATALELCARKNAVEFQRGQPLQRLSFPGGMLLFCPTAEK